MAKYLCVERCYDSTKHQSYYEDTPYELGRSEVEHLKKIGQFKRFQAMAEPEPPKATESAEEAAEPKGKKAGREKE